MKRWSMLLASMFVSSAVIADADQMQDMVDALNRVAPGKQQGTLETLEKPHGEYSSVNQMSRRAVQEGAIYQIKLQIPPGVLGKHLAAYSAVYLPVDQFVCDDPKIQAKRTLAAKCESSGRKLVSVLSREHGDEYNVVFLYKYESAYKEDYYCKYPKAFLLYHATHASPFLMPNVNRRSDSYPLKRALDRQAGRDKATDLDDLLAWLPESCSNLPPAGEARRRALAALEVVQDLLQVIDLYFAETTVASQGSWYFDVSPCKAGVLDGDATTEDDELKKQCPEFRESVLERAAGLKWWREWSSKP